MSKSGACLTLFKCTNNIASLPFRSGSSTGTRLSNLPGLKSAGSSVSGLFVAANMTTPLLASKPSISESNWFSVCSLSSLPPRPAESLFFPIVSISSINTIQGAFLPASLNKSLTFAAPKPTNISTKSEPVIEKKGTSASPATALANKVFPVPGGPTSNAPLGSFAPMAAYFCGLCKYSTISDRASFASSCPATSSKVIPSVGFT